MEALANEYSDHNIMKLKENHNRNHYSILLNNTLVKKEIQKELENIFNWMKIKTHISKYHRCSQAVHGREFMH